MNVHVHVPTDGDSYIWCNLLHAGFYVHAIRDLLFENDIWERINKKL